MTGKNGLPLLTTVLVGLWFAMPLPAPCPSCIPGFGLIDITSNDTLRLNVSQPTDPILPAVPCVVQASIVQPPAVGCVECFTNTLAGPVTLTLNAGQTAGLEYPGAFAVGVVPRLSRLSGAGTCLNLTASAEVYDTVTKRSRLLTPVDPVLPTDPMIPPDPMFPLAGLTASDTIRINLFYAPNGPPQIPAPTCTVQAAVRGPSGVLASKTVVLRPGLYDTLTYSDATIAGRRLVRPALHYWPTDPMGLCRNVIPTVELQDTAGRTFVLVPQGPPVQPVR